MFPASGASCHFERPQIIAIRSIGKHSCGSLQVGMMRNLCNSEKLVSCFTSIAQIDLSVQKGACWLDSMDTKLHWYPFREAL